MTKLVRLESDSNLTVSEFTNNLAIALQLGKNASVALKTLTMQFKEPPMTINGTNNEIQFATSIDRPLTNTRTVTLPQGEYAIAQLMSLIGQKMNGLLQSFDVNTSDLGFEWLVKAVGDVANGYTSHIAYKRTDPIDDMNASDCSFRVHGVDNTMNFNLGVYTKNIADDAAKYNAGLITNIFLNRGAWSMGLTVGAQTTGSAIENTDWAFYVGGDSLKNEVTQSALAQLMLCGFMRSSTGTYLFKKNGTMEDSMITITEGDVIKISKKLLGSNSSSQVVYSITDGTQTTNFNGDIIQNKTIELVGAGGKYMQLKVGDDVEKIAFSKINFTPTGSLAVADGIYTEDDTVINCLKNDNLAAVAQSEVTVLFPKEALRLLLGYKFPSMANDSLNYDFVAENTVAFTVFNNDIVVQVPELPLNGYDHGERQSRNMVMVISSGEVRNNLTSKGNELYELSFTETAQPLWIGLHNKQTTFTCPQLSIRVTSEGQTLPMDGKISALLLFRDESDNF
jgi:hypothetical protein